MRATARYFATVALMSLPIVTLSFTSAESHSWYPMSCCSGYDCGEIQSMSRLPDGSLLVTNEHGDTAIFPPGFTIKPPEDDKEHACISKYTKKPICLFLHAGI